MGFINNTSYILNAVLTKKGREYLAKNDAKFNITKFALADDEVDYTLWDTAHPLGTDYYGAVLESMPLVEPVVDPEVVMKYKLITAPVGSKALAAIKNVTPLSVGLLYTIDSDGNGDTEFAWIEEYAPCPDWVYEHLREKKKFNDKLADWVETCKE